MRLPTGLQPPSAMMQAKTNARRWGESSVKFMDAGWGVLVLIVEMFGGRFISIIRLDSLPRPAVDVPALTHGFAVEYLRLAEIPAGKGVDRADIDGFAPLVPLLGIEARTALDIPAEERALVAHAEFEAQGAARVALEVVDQRLGNAGADFDRFFADDV